MSVIINNMAMPETCYECRFHETSYFGRAFCVAHLNYIEDPRSGRLETCPLEELPDRGAKMCLFEPIHGRCPECDDNCDKCSYWYEERSEE